MTDTATPKQWDYDLKQWAKKITDFAKTLPNYKGVVYNDFVADDEYMVTLKFEDVDKDWLPTYQKFQKNGLEPVLGKSFQVGFFKLDFSFFKKDLNETSNYDPVALIGKKVVIVKSNEREELIGKQGVVRGYNHNHDFFFVSFYDENNEETDSFDFVRGDFDLIETPSFTVEFSEGLATSKTPSVSKDWESFQKVLEEIGTPESRKDDNWRYYKTDLVLEDENGKIYETGRMYLSDGVDETAWVDNGSFDPIKYNIKDAMPYFLGFVSQKATPSVSEEPKEVSFIPFSKPENRRTKAIRKSVEAAKEPTNAQNKLLNLADSIKKYNTDIEYLDKVTGEKRTYTISDMEMRVWVTYQVEKGVYPKATITKNEWSAYYDPHVDWAYWQRQGFVAFDGKNYVPNSLFYAGNIYEKIQSIKAKRDVIVEKIGEAEYDKQLMGLEAAKPKLRKLSFDPTELLYINIFDNAFWEKIRIEAFADGTELGKEMSVPEAFIWEYIDTLDQREFVVGKVATDKYDIKNHWYTNDRFPNNTTESEKAARKRNASIVGSELFRRFLVDGLTEADKRRIEYLWNSERNFYADVEYYRIPVGFEVNQKFKNAPLSIRPAQREGVGFFSHRVRGICAYDVGVGKTMTAILNIGDGFSKGLWQRFLVVVPKKVYAKWKGEINGVYADKDIKDAKGKVIHKRGDLLAEGILPQIPIVDLFNLGVDTKIDQDFFDNLPQKCIFMMSYEGLQQLGFDRKTEGQLTNELITIMSQGETGRKAALKSEKIQELIYEMLDKSKYAIEDFGIDAICTDEAHNFRNLFMQILGDATGESEKGGIEREEKRFFAASGSGEPSGRALKLFAINKYIQLKHNGRNTFGLTATPFTNRATEIFSQLSHFDSESLKEFGCYNLSQFCKQHIEETFEATWTSKGKFEIKAVIRAFQNLPILQTMLFRSIIYKTGEEVKIPRPQKVILPLMKDEVGNPLSSEYIVDTRLPATADQLQMMKWIFEFAKWSPKSNNEHISVDNPIIEEYPPKTDERGREKIDGQLLIALNLARMTGVSPYLSKMGKWKNIDPKNVSWEDFIASSPKLLYTIECIKSVVDYHKRRGEDVSGQLIYLGRGLDFFPQLREAIIRKTGLSPSEVAVIKSGMSDDAVESVKDDYQSGKIKVIIGTETMREGVDLQNHTSVIYIDYLDWNPTDLHQLFGRGWRFGNRHSHIRLVVPMTENSSDIHTWQKLSEKMSRLNSIWTRGTQGTMFAESELNAEELKRGLITNPEELADYELGELRAELEAEKSVLTGRIELTNKVYNDYSKLTTYETQIRQAAIEATTNPTNFYSWLDNEELDKNLDKLKKKVYDPNDIKTAFSIVKIYDEISRNGIGQTVIDEYLKTKKRVELLTKDPYFKDKLGTGVEFFKAIQDYKATLEIENEKIAERKEKLTGAAAKERLVEKWREIKQKEAETAKSLLDRVKDFERLNYLLECRFGRDMCDLYGRVQRGADDVILPFVSDLQFFIDALELELAA